MWDPIEGKTVIFCGPIFFAFTKYVMQGSHNNNLIKRQESSGWYHNVFRFMDYVDNIKRLVFAPKMSCIFFLKVYRFVFGNSVKL